MIRLLSVAALSALVFSGTAQATEYTIDTGHSSVNFKIRHLVSKTTGKFEKFKGTINYEKGKPESWKVDAEIDANSINTNEPKRDAHLRGPDFFDVKKYPKLTFKSTKVLDADDEKAKLQGDLTMHGVTKPVVLDVELGGEGTDPWGNKKVGFTATTKVNRKDFGLNWNKALETGGLLVGDDVEINLEIEADQAKPARVADKTEATKKKAKK